FRWPGILHPGDIDKLTAHIDMFPTFAELAGAKIPAGLKLDGRSLVPLLRNHEAAWPDRYLFTHVGRWPAGKAAEAKYTKCSVRNTRYNMVGMGPAKKWELYDIKADPGEENDIAERNPEVVRRLDAAYDKWWEEILPCLENENAVPPKVGPFTELYYEQFGGGPK
ncbi:MAG: DUF4976 domain-containing protein, partial [Acidobacteria bacterium]|nr:DUF4976 domain-containing protein [Acidobacteriota bacterium]